MCHMMTIKYFKVVCFYFLILLSNKKQNTGHIWITWGGKKEAKTAHFMKVLLTMYNRIKAFINNMDTFHIFEDITKKFTCNIFQRGPAQGYK